MTDDPLAVLERELVAAARRRSDAAAGRAERRRWRSGSLSGAGTVLSVAACVAVVVAVGAAVLLAAHGSRGPSVRSGARAEVSGRQALIDELAVLRRPQTAADRALPRGVMSPGPLLALRGAPDLSLVRLATVTPWGARVFLVPLKPPTPEQVNGLPALLRAKELESPVRVETLSVFSGGGGGGGGTAADLAAQGTWVSEGAGRSFAGGSSKTRFVVVVPDGVARIGLYFPTQRLPAGGPRQPGLTVTAPVHSNVVALQVDRDAIEGVGPLFIWYAADGHVIKRIGDFAAARHLKPTPQAGPETALSRAAERDPSTPNPVWVTPAVGGAASDFRVHFRVLLNDADYTYAVSGPRCPQITFSGGGGGGPLDVRGRISSGVLSAVQGRRWCRGTYRVAVSVMDLGRAGTLKHPARPFGSATFAVR